MELVPEHRLLSLLLPRDICDLTGRQPRGKLVLSQQFQRRLHCEGIGPSDVGRLCVGVSMNQTEVSQDKEKEREYEATRAARRYVPLETVNAVGVSEDFIVAHGIVSNISETGACLITNTVIEPGQTLQIRFNTCNKTDLFQTSAKVVWSGEGMDPNLEIVGVMVGIAFMEVSYELQDTITDILEKGNFHEVGAADVQKKAAVAVSKS